MGRHLRASRIELRLLPGLPSAQPLLQSLRDHGVGPGPLLPGRTAEQVPGSIIDAFGDEFTSHANRTTPPVEPMLIAELIDIRDDAAVLGERHPAKQPDWTYNPRCSRATPFDILSAKTPPWGGGR